VRSLFVRLHRWLGLATALFLFIAGVTGAIISWDHELDEWLNPEFYEAHTPGTARNALDLAAAFEAADPRVRVRYLPLSIEPGHTLLLMVEPRVNPATGQLHALGFNQVALDPVSGAVLAQREWGKVSLERQNLLSFLYKLHYSLHIPDGFGLELGVLFMGFIAMAWVLDTLIALWISFPNFSAWRQSFAFRWRAGGYKRIFDLHRSGGVWIFLLLLILSVTSVGMNLREPVMRPIVSWFSTLTPSPFASRTPVVPEQAVEPSITLAQLLARGQQEAVVQNISAPAGAIFLASSFSVYGVGFFEGDNSHGDGGLGNPWLYFDTRTGETAGADIPGRGTAGDIFLQAMFPLHSGRILGLAGRILISLCGIAVATLCVTGVLIWARKRKGRVRQLAGGPATRSAAKAFRA
jgi:uncharacterized iron-regulated membrane protein